MSTIIERKGANPIEIKDIGCNVAIYTRDDCNMDRSKNDLELIKPREVLNCP